MSPQNINELPLLAQLQCWSEFRFPFMSREQKDQETECPMQRLLKVNDKTFIDLVGFWRDSQYTA